MALAGEIASLYVRIRPNLSGFAGETTAGVNTALTEVQAKVAATARANVAATMDELNANRALATSYSEIAGAAVRGSDEARVAAEMSARATVAANDAIGASAAKAGERVGFLKKHILNMGSALGIGFGLDIGVKLVKDITSAAANVQKSIEVIKHSFGPDASKVIVRFGDTVASKLGVTAQLADATSARFGILFTNMGIGVQRAAGMTIGLEKLAGSIAAIKGIDPALAFNQISTALAGGNTRSLKQLGLAIDPATEKIAALKLGLISSVKDALTPATRAEAIYALATAHLGDFQAQAAAHAGDYANVQRRLSAEFSNAKDVIGTALLPMFSKYSTELGNWLQKMIRSGQLQRDFNGILVTAKKVLADVATVLRTGWTIVQTVTGWVGGFSNAIKILIGLKVAAWVVGAVAGIGKVAAAETVATTRAGVLKLAIEALGGAEVLGPLALLAGAIAAIIWGFNQAAKETQGFHAKMGLIVRDKKTGALSFREDTANRGPNPMHRITPDQALALSTDQTLAQIISSARAVARAKADSPRIGAAAVRAAQDQVEQARTVHDKVVATARLDAIKSALAAERKAALDGLKANAAAIAAAQTAANAQVMASVAAAKKNLDSIAAKLAASVNKFLGKGSLLETSPQGVAFKKLAALLAHGGDTTQIERAGQQLSTELQVKAGAAGSLKQRQDAVKTHFANLVAEFNKGQISLETFNKRVATLLAKDGLSYKTAGKKLGVAFASGFQDEMRALHGQAAAIAALPASLRRAGGSGLDLKIIQPLNVLHTDNARIAARAERQREHQIKVSTKIAADTAKANSLLHQIATTPIGTLPGNAGKKAKHAAQAGAQP